LIITEKKCSSLGFLLFPLSAETAEASPEGEEELREKVSF
jgi:hypothetical protein